MRIVPHQRLLFWFAIVALPFSVVGTLHAHGLALSLSALAVLMLVALVDALAGQGRLEGVVVTLPPVLRLAKEREGTLELRLDNPHSRPRHLRLGIAWPPGLQSAEAERHVLVPASALGARVAWPCRGWRRGRYRLRQVHLETPSPWGFWAVRSTVAVATEVRVYPNLLTEQRQLAALFLHRGSPGFHAQRQVGKGREFEKLREYSPGDSFDEIHWKATAKRGHPVTKVYQVERTQEIYVVIDASRLSARPAAPDPAREEPAGETILERFITAALVLGLAAEQHGDRFGVAAFTDRMGRFIRAGNGRAHYGACRDALFNLEPHVVTPDFDEAAVFLRLQLRRRALVVFLTCLDDPVLAEQFSRRVDLLARRHVVLVNMVRPPSVHPLFQIDTPRTVNDLYGHLAGHLQWDKLRELERLLRRRGVRFSLLENAQLSVQLVSQYLGVKQRQLL